MALSKGISNTTSTSPWSIGNWSDGETGWPLTDWLKDVLLHSAGPGVYDDLIAHEIAWTDAEVVSATAILVEVFGNEAYQLVRTVLGRIDVRASRMVHRVNLPLLVYGY
jgi:hypothetical protein